MSDEERWGRHLANKAAMHGLSDAGPMSAEAKLDRFRDHHREQVDALNDEVAALTAERDVDRATCEVALANLAKMRAERDRLREEIDVVKAEWEDALRAHADASGQLTSARRSIEGLRTRMLAAEAERDRLREELAAVAEQSAVANPYWRIRSERAKAERDTLAAQLARAETVIAAAVAVLRVTGSDWADSPIERLRTAVDAYQATPATTREGAGNGDPA